MAYEFRIVGVVGLGTIGSGIVEVLARSGIDVIAAEVDEMALDRGRAAVTASMDRAVSRGKLSAPERDALLGRIRFVVGMDGFGDVDLAIEAVPEQMVIKRRVFAELDRVCPDSAVLATGTSSLSVTEIAAATRRPDRVVGMHFFVPAPVMKMVEVIRTVVTSPEVIRDTAALCERLGKVSVTINDRAGFIANGLLCGYLNRAVAMYESGYVSREDLDAAMTLGAGLPMGPLALIDLIGVDVALEILNTIYHSGGRDRRHAPAPLIKQMVTAGLLGRKTGRGFYTYVAEASPVVVPDELTPADGHEQPVDAAQPIATVGVAGSGVMATGIVEVFARGGYLVVAVTRGEEKSARMRDMVTASMTKAVGRGKMTEADRDAALARVTWGSSMDRLTEADLVVEAVVEELTVKKAMFASLNEICKPDAVLATTTSSLPVIECAMATTAGAGGGAALLQPSPADATSRGGTNDPHLGADGRRRPGGVRAAGQDRHRLRGTGRFHRQRAAVSLPQRRGSDAGVVVLDHRRHRQRHETGLRVSDGAVPTAGRRRPRRVAGHPARAVPRGPRTWPRTGTAAGTPGYGRIPGQEGRPRLPRLHHPVKPSSGSQPAAPRHAGAGSHFGEPPCSGSLRPGPPVPDH